MKRTVQRADRTEQRMPEDSSGCRQFEGEDLSKYQFKFASTSWGQRYGRQEIGAEKNENVSEKTHIFFSVSSENGG